MRLFNRMGRHKTPDADQMLDAAMAVTGLSDFGRSSFTSAYRQLIEQVNREGNLSNFGRYAIGRHLANCLCSRLLLSDSLTHRTSLPAITCPVVIVGLYRSGTTYAHRVIHRHFFTRAPRLWEMRSVGQAMAYREVDESRARQKTAWQCLVHRYLSPDYCNAHPIGANIPEECVHLLENAAFNSTLLFTTEAKSIADQFLSEAHEYEYRLYRHQLRLLQSEAQQAPWLLKWPYHLWKLDTLLRTFPNARIIYLQREPERVLPSLCSLSALARKPFVNAIDYAALGRFWMTHCSLAVRNADAVLQNHEQAICVDYHDLCARPGYVLSQIEERFGLRPRSEPLAAGADAERAGRHRYSAEDFGLTDVAIRSVFSDRMQNES